MLNRFGALGFLAGTSPLLHKGSLTPLRLRGNICMGVSLFSGNRVRYLRPVTAVPDQRRVNSPVIYNETHESVQGRRVMGRPAAPGVPPACPLQTHSSVSCQGCGGWHRALAPGSVAPSPCPPLEMPGTVRWPLLFLQHSTALWEAGI